MLTTFKSESVTKWTWSGTGFVRKSPSEKQVVAPKFTLLFLRARYYDPGTGEFVSRDPLGYVDGMSQYRAYFVPTRIDPSGKASESQINDDKLQYSCRCGWLDWSHAGGSDRAVLKKRFSKVWAQISGAKQQGEKIRVCYQQQQGKWGFSSGYKKCYWVKAGLSASEQKCVAWQIFKEVSEGFEEHQTSYGKPINNSGFSPEDLISDLMLFNRVVKGYSRSQIEDLCYVVKGKEINLRMYKAFSSWGLRPREWAAIRFHPNHWVNTPGIGCGPCGDKDPGYRVGQTPSFPKELGTPKCASNARGTLFGDDDSGEEFFNSPSYVSGFLSGVGF